MGGLSGLFSNMGNPGIDNPQYRLAWNLLDPGGTTGTIASQVGSSEATEEWTGVDPTPEQPNVPIVPTASEVALETNETARQEEMRKRRLRTKTLLSTQEDAGMATVGTKTLLGS